jgi:hypothetical protein
MDGSEHGFARCEVCERIALRLRLAAAFDELTDAI